LGLYDKSRPQTTRYGTVISQIKALMKHIPKMNQENGEEQSLPATTHKEKSSEFWEWVE
jgi:hypothetical protein